MQLRCKEGDLALVIHDTPPCAANIGRIVEVSGPVELSNRFDGLACWLIRPVRMVPYLMERCGKAYPELIGWLSKAEHPDAWLLPLARFPDHEPEQKCEDADDSAGQPQRRQELAPVPATSMGYRPRSYFGFADLQVELLGRVKGDGRRGALRLLLGKGSQIPEDLKRAAISDADIEATGRMHPVFIRGEYLPTVQAGEIEIARVSTLSISYDVVSVYAKQNGNRIHYRVVDEHEDETLTDRSTRTSLRPLTMGELMKFFLGAWDLFSFLKGNFGGDLEVMLDSFDGESEFYPYFDSALRQGVCKRFQMRQGSA